MGAFPPGFQSRYYFDRDDGERWIVATNDEALWPAIANAAWTGKAVELSGLESPKPGQINVTGLGLVDQPPVEARNLSSFARPSASSVLPSDRLGTYHAWSAVDGQLASPWCEGADLYRRYQITEAEADLIAVEGSTNNWPPLNYSQ